MDYGPDRQLPPVLKQERERLVDRKNVLEASINRISKEFQSLAQELFNDEIKALPIYKFELRIEEYLGWVYDKHKGFRSKSERSQDLRQWLNSTKARKWADSLFGDMLDSCRQYAWEVGHALENSAEGIEYLTNYLQCEFFIATMTGTIGSGSGSGSRPLICDHSFHKRKSKMLTILNEGVYSNKKNSNDWIKKKTKTKKEGGTTAKKYFVEFYKKWSDRYFALYIMYKTQYKHIPLPQQIQDIPPMKNEMIKIEPVTMQVDMNVKMETQSIEDKTEMELGSEEDKENEENDDDDYENENNEDEDNNDDGDEDNENIEDSSSDAPLIKVENHQERDRDMLKKEKEKEKEPEPPKEKNESLEKDLLQKLHRDNQEMKQNMDQMESKIRQLTSYRELEISSLRRQLNASNQRTTDAESKNIEYERRIRSINEEMVTSKHQQQSLINELYMLRMRLEMIQAQSSNHSSMGMMNQNGNMFGYNNNNLPPNMMHPNVAPLQMPHSSYPPLQSMSAIPSLPSAPFHSMFGFSSNDHNNSASNLYLPPLLSGDGNHSPLANNNNTNNLLSNNNGDGGHDMDTMHDFGLKRPTAVLGGRTSFDWNPSNSSEDLNMFPNSPFHSAGNMDVDLDNTI